MNQDGRLGAGTLLVLGFFLGLLQFNFYFLTEVYISSRSISFFVVLFFWLCGFYAGLRPKAKLSYLKFLVWFSLIAYYLFYFLVTWFSFQSEVYIAAALCVFAAGILPGYLFSAVSVQTSEVRWVLFHENNGFVLGFLLATILAVFAGSWLLSIGVVSAGVMALLSLKPKAETATLEVFEGEIEGEGRLEGPFPFWMVGLYLGVIQSSIYFVCLVYVSATYFIYFAMTLIWLLGASVGVKTNWIKKQSTANVLSFTAYVLIFLIARQFPGETNLSSLYMIFIFVAALPAGVFFKIHSNKILPRSILFHENNGFILGYVVMTFAFLKTGTTSLLFGPLMGFFLILFRHSKKIFPSWMSCGLKVLSNESDSPTLKPEQTALKGSVLKTLLFLGGFNLLLVEFLTIRLFSNILAASELSILLITVTVFIGYSVGYAKSNLLTFKSARGFLVFFFGLQLAILLYVKAGASAMIAAGWGMSVFWLLLVLTAFFTVAPYAVFVPLCANKSQGLGLKNAYFWNLLGSALGLLTVWALLKTLPYLLLPLYLVGLAAMIFLVSRSGRTRVTEAFFFGFVILVVALTQSVVSQKMDELYYKSRGYSNPKMVYRGHSFYHSIDVFDTYRSPYDVSPKARFSLINGVKFFGYQYDPSGKFANETSLSEFTYFLAELPAKYLAEKLGRKPRVLILGGGSLYSIKRVHSFSEKVTLVEIDDAVVQSSREHWKEINRLDEIKNFEIIIDDARRYLRETKETYDLIINDISAPYYLGTALMHSQDLFELAQTRLAPGGIFSESTQGRPRIKRKNDQGRKILKGMTNVFDETLLVREMKKPRGRRGYVYGVQKGVLDVSSFKELVRGDQMYEGIKFTSQPDQVWDLSQITPFSYTNFDTLIHNNISRIKSRLD